MRKALAFTSQIFITLVWCGITLDVATSFWSTKPFLAVIAAFACFYVAIDCAKLAFAESAK